ncbi:MAG: undecaprenyl-diphosphate phosphatase, partial [Clostridiales bacterium]|nr:undecaprenyl-diphosphate phosphatase [Candidatus Apopatousia equi]
ILGLVQGLTEFLPVSSSGHLVLLENIFGIENNVILFDVILHVGTLCAVIIVYRKTIWDLIKHPFSEKAQKLIFATIPTLIIALIFKGFFEKSFNGDFLALGFLTTAIFLIIAQVISNKQYQYRELDYKNAMVIGVFQGLAILPGISRSGSTITSAIVQGVRRDDAAEFSFLLSIPIILASLVYECIKIPGTTITISFWAFLIGFIFSVISGIFAIKIMLKVVKKAKYQYFSIYLILLSIILFLNQFVFKWF